MTTSRAVLITGCSSGIGAATAARLVGRGWNVYATARRPETLSDLEAQGCKTLACDVDDETSCKAAVDAVVQAEGAVGVLINNAGFSQSGAVESIPDERVRAQFDTNVFGLLSMCRAALPSMRAQGWGKVVNISSMGGEFVFPGGGLYHATKYAIEALSDALRYEVAGFGIDVLGGPPDAVAEVIEKALSASKPKTRYKVTPSARVMMTLHSVAGDRGWDRICKGSFPQPGVD
jgi:NAD(P)-dependent dehydrogenase (short-subunit alcohol dehydrogenase family)